MILDRLIRYRDAPGYLGMDKNRFDAEVRPLLTELPVGKQGIGFDRLDLDEWFEDYKSRVGRPGRKPRGDRTWQNEPRPYKKGRVLAHQQSCARTANLRKHWNGRPR